MVLRIRYEQEDFWSDDVAELKAAEATNIVIQAYKTPTLDRTLRLYTIYYANGCG